MIKSGIYKIQSIASPEKIYIGSAINLINRKAVHYRDLKLKKHCNTRLQNHYNKYGKNDLVFIILEICKPADLISVEQKYINELTPFFNINKIAGSSLGFTHSLETRYKMSQSHMGRTAWNKGLSLSEEHKKKVGESKKGNTNMLGKKHTLKSKIKMSETRKGRKYTKEHKTNISKALKGREFTETHKLNISKAKKKYYNNLKMKHHE